MPVTPIDRLLGTARAERPAESGAPKAPSTRERAASASAAADSSAHDPVTLSPEAARLQAAARLTAVPLEATEGRVAQLLEQSYEELYERAGKSAYLASIADTSDTSPEATAGRILGGITGYIYGAFRLANPDPNAETLERFRGQVLEGFATGLRQAKDLVGALGKLDDATASAIDETEALVREGLDAFFATEAERAKVTRAALAKGASASERIP